MSADLPRLTDAERADVARWLRTAAEGGGLTLRQEARDLALQIADRLDAATDPAPGLQAADDAASGDARSRPCAGCDSIGQSCRATGCPATTQRPEPDAGDVNRLLEQLPMSDDGTGHIADCGYTHGQPRCGCSTLRPRLQSVIGGQMEALLAPTPEETP